MAGFDIPVSTPCPLSSYILGIAHGVQQRIPTDVVAVSVFDAVDCVWFGIAAAIGRLLDNIRTDTPVKLALERELIGISITRGVGCHNISPEEQAR
jgi:hypothetical protein